MSVLVVANWRYLWQTLQEMCDLYTSLVVRIR